MMTAPARHWFDEHTADVRLSVEAPDLAGLLVEAGRAVGELMGGEDLPMGEGPWVALHVEAPDRDALLVRFIDELVFLSEIHKRVWTGFRVERVDDRAVDGCAVGGCAVDAAIRGPEVEALRTAVKAATFHGLRVVEEGGVVRASVVLDV